MLELEQVLEVGELALEHIGHARLGYLALDHILVAGMAEQPQVPVAGIVEVILQRDIVEQAAGDILFGRGISAVFTAHNDLEAVVKQRLGQTIALAGLGASILLALVLVDTEREVDAGQRLCRPCVELRLQEREQCRRSRQVIDIACAIGTRIGIIQQ